MTACTHIKTINALFEDSYDLNVKSIILTINQYCFLPIMPIIKYHGNTTHTQINPMRFSKNTFKLKYNYY